MRLWHYKLIPYLDRQRLLGQHRECCALRGKGWGKKHATVDYVFTHPTEWLVVYHHFVMDEMEKRGYHPDHAWDNANWRGTTLGIEEGWANQYIVNDIYCLVQPEKWVYPEHDDAYLRECINLLKEKQAPIDWEKVEQDGLFKI